MLQKAKQLGKAQLLWAVAVESGKITPKGVALVTKKEIIVKAAAPVSLQ